MATDDPDFDRWLDQLAGRRRPDAPGDEVEEVRRLRRSIGRHALREPPAHADADADRIDVDEEHAWHAMQFKLRRAGVPQPKPRRRTFWLPLAAAAALLLAVGTVAVLQLPDGGDEVAVAMEAPPRYFGDLPVIEVGADDPLRQARRLARALGPLEAAPKVYFHERRATVEFGVRPARRDAVGRELAALGVPAGALATGVNRVVFSPR